MILSATDGDNSDLFRNAAALYLSDSMRVADITYGKGVFWKKIDMSRYRVETSDLLSPTAEHKYDFRSLPYNNGSFDAVVFDPPYMHNPGKPVVDANYRNSETSSSMYHSDIINEFYRRGMSEGLRILKPGGFLFVKCADQIESGCQCRGHIEVWEIATRELDMIDKDLFVLVNSGGAVQQPLQQHSRKNVSFLWVFIKTGTKVPRPVRRRFQTQRPARKLDP